jgi:hypothetical protein
MLPTHAIHCKARPVALTSRRNDSAVCAPPPSYEAAMAETFGGIHGSCRLVISCSDGDIMPNV